VDNLWIIFATKKGVFDTNFFFNTNFLPDLSLLPLLPVTPDLPDLSCDEGHIKIIKISFPFGLIDEIMELSPKGGEVPVRVQKKEEAI
jgi:hypothetical protein